MAIKRRRFLASAGLFAMWPYSLVHAAPKPRNATTANLPRVNSLTSGSSARNPAYVIAEPCIGTKDTACVDVCPVDCIHPKKDEKEFEKEKQLYIDPEVCIGCSACETACPASAIFPIDLVPDQWKQYIKINADWYKKNG